MKRVNQEDFTNFTVSGDGWNLTVWELKKAVREYDNLRGHAILYGNRPDGSRMVIDSK